MGGGPPDCPRGGAGGAGGHPAYGCPHRRAEPGRRGRRCSRARGRARHRDSDRAARSDPWFCDPGPRGAGRLAAGSNRDGAMNAIAIRSPAVARPRLQAWLRMVATVLTPLVAGAIAMVVAQLIGVTGRERSAIFYGVQLVGGLGVVLGAFGLRTVGIGVVQASAALVVSG